MYRFCSLDGAEFPSGDRVHRETRHSRMRDSRETPCKRNELLYHGWHKSRYCDSGNLSPHSDLLRVQEDLMIQTCFHRRRTPVECGGLFLRAVLVMVAGSSSLSWYLAAHLSWLSACIADFSIIGL